MHHHQKALLLRFIKEVLIFKFSYYIIKADSSFVPSCRKIKLGLIFYWRNYEKQFTD